MVDFLITLIGLFLLTAMYLCGSEVGYQEDDFFCEVAHLGVIAALWVCFFGLSF